MYQICQSILLTRKTEEEKKIGAGEKKQGTELLVANKKQASKERRMKERNDRGMK